MSIRTHVTSAELVHLTSVGQPAVLDQAGVDVGGLQFPVLVIDDLYNGERWVIGGDLGIFLDRLLSLDMAEPR